MRLVNGGGGGRTIPADAQEHGDADVVDESKGWVFGEEGVPDNEELWEGELSAGGHS